MQYLHFPGRLRWTGGATHPPRHMFDDCIRTEGTVIRTIRAGLHLVALKNGKEVTAHLSKSLAEASTTFEDGTRVLLDMTPFDFNQARIEAALPERDGAVADSSDSSETNGQK